MSSTPKKKKKKNSSSSSNHHKSGSRSAENSDPNLLLLPPTTPTPSSKTPAFTKPKKITPVALPKIPRDHHPPPPLPKQRRFFVVSKKASRKEVLDPKECQEQAYESLRASQEEFFKKGGDFGSAERKSLIMEEAMSSVPELGYGRVKHLVEAFERMLSISGGMRNNDKSLAVAEKWVLPGLRRPAAEVELLPTEDFGRDSWLYSSLDGNGERLSWGSRRSSGSHRIQHNVRGLLFLYCEACKINFEHNLDYLNFEHNRHRLSWNKKLKVTSQQPFKLRTELRGRLKEENFLQKVKEMIMYEEKKRIPIAQGLPWTTDEPECLVKPPVKESTEPIDVVLHSDVRAVERAEFDHHIAERLSLAEQIRLERERQRKLEEEEEIRRLRRELVPKAQPMPYFDRPFVPKRSTRPRTVPKEPRFHVRPVKSSW